MVEVKSCRYGRGVFATRTIAEGEIIFLNHMLLLDPSDRKGSETLRRYDFGFESDDDLTGIALGEASLINHSFERTNADYFTFFEKGLPFVVVFAAEQIKAGNQVFIDYGYDPKDN